jgi:hypothetical protein
MLTIKSQRVRGAIAIAKGMDIESKSRLVTFCIANCKTVESKTAFGNRRQT